MESLVLDIQSKIKISDYIENTHLMKYEAGIMTELLLAVEQGDIAQLTYLNSFGDSFRAITMNLHAYRKGLEFGFKAIAFNQYGWFERPVWLEVEEHKFGDTSRYGNHSTITLGRGLNHIWTYALNYSFGCAGGGWALSVYDKQFASRDDAFTGGLTALKIMMTARIGSKDTTNDKQPIILATLRDIEKAKLNIVQLCLF